MTSISRPSGFPKACRIVQGRDYQSVKHRGVRVSTRYFVVYAAHPAVGQSRLGIIASRKYGNAVCRNRFKRMIREVFRTNRATLQPPLDLVIIAKRLSEKPGYHEYERDFLQGIARARRRLARHRSGS